MSSIQPYLNLEIGSKQWSDLLINEAKMLSVDVNVLQIASMETHALELLKWNKITNLTSIVNPLEIAVKHFLDSLAVTPFIYKKARVLDIGSGAGFPGIPLKIILPELFVTMVDSSRKKKSFLKHIIRTLNLGNSFAIHSRCEDMAKMDIYKNSFDVIICRAFTALGNFIKIAVPFLDKNGTIIALKGKLDEFENAIDGIDMNKDFVSIDNVFSIRNYFYKLPILESHRNIIFIKQI